MSTKKVASTTIRPEPHVAAPKPTLPINPDEWIEAVLSEWRYQGHRCTGPRARVLRHIAHRTAPFSAEQVYIDLLQIDDGPPPGRATVYRAIEQLLSRRWITRVYHSHAHVESTYIVTWPAHLHHLVCTSCGQVVQFYGCGLDEMLATLATHTNFLIQGHLLEIYGRCIECCSVTPQSS